MRTSRADRWVTSTTLLRVFAVATAAAYGQQLTYQKVPGSPPSVTHIFEDSRQRLWVGTNSGAYLFDGVRFYPLQGAREGGMNSQVHQIAEDRDGVTAGGAIWFATMDGLYHYRHGRLILPDFRYLAAWFESVT